MRNNVIASKKKNDTLMFLESHTKKIQDTLKNIVKDFIYIGFLLWEIREYKYYVAKGYRDIVEYAESELGFKKSSTYNFIRICEEFSKRTNANTPSMFLKEKYENYSYSQLTEILSLAPEKREKVKENMTVKEIRQLKSEVQTSGIKEDKEELIQIKKQDFNEIKEFFERAIDFLEEEGNRKLLRSMKKENYNVYQIFNLIYGDLKRVKELIEK